MGHFASREGPSQDTDAKIWDVPRNTGWLATLALSTAQNH